MRNKNIIRILALVIAFSMIFTTAVFATPKHNKIDKKVKNYEGALKSLIQKEIVKGYGNGDYGLSGNVKRGDVIVMIVRMLDRYGVIDEDDYNVEKLSKNYLKIFDDVDYKDYFYGHISIAKKLGIAKGDGKYFKPNKPVTNQEAIWLIERAGDILDIEFNSDKIDELEEIYKGDLNDFAKRRDVFWMLFLILSDLEIDEEDDDNNIDDITLKMSDDETFKFTDKMFERALGDDIEYIKFTLLPNEDNGVLYYNYSESSRRNTLISESEKYYITDEDLDDELRISKISFKPKHGFDGKVNIKYKAYYDDEVYNGMIIITVQKGEELKDIKYKVKENNNLKFDYKNFESNIDEVTFTLLDEKVGTLYFDNNKDGKLSEGEKIVKNEEISRSDLRYVYFVPYQDYTGDVTINYMAYDGTKEFDGKVIVDIESVQEIETISFEKRLRDESIVIDFDDEIYESIGRELYNKIDYVKFTLPDKGQLLIKYDDNDYKTISKGTKYYIDEIKDIKYTFDGRGTVNINYTLYDEDTTINDKAYDGLIKIEVMR